MTDKQSAVHKQVRKYELKAHELTIKGEPIPTELLLEWGNILDDFDKCLKNNDPEQIL
jgi:hypothetical protein